MGGAKKVGGLLTPAFVIAAGKRGISRGIDSERASGRVFFGISGALFAGSAAVMIVWCESMSGGMPMPGGWMMSMAWMPMCGQTWPGVVASFLGMWTVMMAAMMLPSLAPTLWHYYAALGRTGETRAAVPAMLIGAGYLFVWIALGIAIFPLGVALTAAGMRWPALARAVPAMVGVVLVIAGALQFSAWKARHLACCRAAPERGDALPADTGTAWRCGLRLGLHCCCSCIGLTASLLAVGIMDLHAMAVATVAITAERVAPSGERVAQAVGVAAVGAGVLLIANAVCGTT